MLSFSTSELLVSASALMQHHRSQLQKFQDSKHTLNLDERAQLASYLCTCEQLMQKLQHRIEAASSG